MIPNSIKPRLVVLLALAGVVAISLAIRALPWFQMDFGTLELLGDPDVWYNYRQIEIMVSDFPRYAWFDPMTAYPVGKHLDWGPLFPLIASVLCLAAGATSRVAILSVSSWLPVLFGLLMIPVVFVLVRLIAGWKAGIIAAFFIAVVSGEYFYRTMAGVVDHHAAEIFFTTVFCLCYISTIRKASEQETDFRNPASILPLIIPAGLAGIALAAGLAVMPTVLIFAMTAAVYTLIQYTRDAFQGKRRDELVLLNGVVAACAIAGLALIGTRSPVYSLTTYSPALIHACILLFCGTVLLWVYSLAAREKPWVFVGLIIGTIAAAIVASLVIDTSFFSSGVNVFSTFFGQSYGVFPIEELKPWSLWRMWGSFNIGIILAAIGAVVLAYRYLKEGCPAHLFVLVWGAVVVLATVQHSRFEYYSAVPIVIAAAFFLGYAFIYDEPGTTAKTSSAADRKGKKERKKRKDMPGAKSRGGILPNLEGTGTSFVLACVVIFCGASLLSDYSVATRAGNALIPQQWTGVLEWIEDETPDPGVPYLGPYPSEGWKYPPDSYGVLSWWDFGHWITFVSGRIPVTNPFQDNVRLSSAYFFADSEPAANGLADRLGAQYIITDWKMVESKFPAMVVWYNSFLPDTYYLQEFLVPKGQGEGNQTRVMLYKTPYYQTMVSRLHNLDGSMSAPESVVYIEYDAPRTRSGIPAATLYEVLDSAAAHEMLARFESDPPAGKRALIANTGPDAPADTVGALRHYRLVYEQAREDAAGYNLSQSVKVFEYVQGAEMEGEGIIEVTLETNLGRTFIYRQESEDGTFILPYATRDNPYPVKTVGPYRLVDTGRTIEVTDQDVREGRAVGRE
ncbi:MAG: oligosaccharyl transferase, archaeosortase A system-associated [Methanoregulaceae archaeon]